MIKRRTDLLSPPLEIKYIVYSNKIWNNFLKCFKDKNSKIADFGCNEGTTLYCLEQLGYKKLFGLDLTYKPPKGFLRHSKYYKRSVLNSKFDNNYFNGIISTMVIEHVPDRLFVKEIYRVLKNKGYALITSVIKNKYAWYFYKNKYKKRVLEPTHLREYHSLNEFLNLFKRKFTIIDVQKTNLKYSITDPILKALYHFTKKRKFLTLPSANFYIRLLKNIRLPIPGYYTVEILVQK